LSAGYSERTGDGDLCGHVVQPRGAQERVGHGQSGGCGERGAAVCRRGHHGAWCACGRKQSEVSTGGGGRGQVCGAATERRELGQGQDRGGSGGGVRAVPGGGVQVDGVAEDGAGDGGFDEGRFYRARAEE